MVSPFATRALEKGYVQESKEKGSSPFAIRAEEKKMEPHKEGIFKTAARYISQIPQGLAKAKTWPLDVISMLARAESLDPEEIEHIKMVSEREGIPFDEESYREAVEQAQRSFPTQGNIAREIEERTGLPLEAKTRGQKLLNLGSSAAGFSGSLSQGAVAGGTAAATSAGAQALGASEGLADFAGLLVGGAAGAKTPKGGIKAAKKESGLTTRQFEKINGPTEVSAKKIGQITETVEKEFRQISKDIIEKSPVGDTFKELKSNPGFKQASQDAFAEVENLAHQIPKHISTDSIKKTLTKNALGKKGTGFLPSEYDKEYTNLIKQSIKETPKQSISAKDLVTQFRKNNRALTEAYEPGKSFAHNRAKREALGEYNRAIAETIKKEFPNTEFSKLFEETNATWAKIKDAEAIDKFLDSLFDGKIRFEKGRALFEKQGMSKPFQRALGEGGYKNFEQLTKDLLSTEQAHKLMKVAETKGFGDFAGTALHYMIHPSLGKLKAGADVAKSAHRAFYEFLLDKPQYVLRFDTAVKAVKAGDFSKAEKEMKSLVEHFDKKIDE